MEQQGETIPPMEQYDDARDTTPEPSHTWPVIPIGIIALCVGIFLGSFLPDIHGSAFASGPDVTLTANERRHGIEMEIHRQNIQFRRNKAAGDYQAVNNRMNEEDVNVQQDQLQFLFDLKKAHELDPGKNYSLDAWRGKLVQQK